MWKIRILLAVVLMIPPAFIGVLYVMVRRAEAEGNKRWVGVELSSITHPNSDMALDRVRRFFGQSSAIGQVRRPREG